MKKSTLFKLKRKLFPNLVKSDEYIDYLKGKGCKIGKGTTIWCAGSVQLDDTRPCLLRIGEYVKIAYGVIVLTHDYSRSVMRRVYGETLGEGKETVIGDNVFIGMNAIILMGSTIGSNVIIGAGSVVGGKIPDNVVVAGNPAKVIRTLEEHYSIRKRKYVEEAKWFVNHFYNTYNRIPTIKELDPFYPIFLERDMKKVEESNVRIRLGGDNYEETVRDFLKSKPLYNGYDEFIKDCLPERKE